MTHINMRARVALHTEKEERRSRSANASTDGFLAHALHCTTVHCIQDMSEHERTNIYSVRLYACSSPAQRPNKPRAVFSSRLLFLRTQGCLLGTPRVHSAVRAARGKPRCKRLQKKRSARHSGSSPRVAPRIPVCDELSPHGIGPARQPSSTPCASARCLRSSGRVFVMHASLHTYLWPQFCCPPVVYDASW